MQKIFGFVVEKPGRSILTYLFLLGVAWAGPTLLFLQPPPWHRAQVWADIVLKLGGLVLVLVGGVIPVITWNYNVMKDIILQKPIVVADLLPDGNHEIRNIGEATAFNVWLVVESIVEPIGLGSLDKHVARLLPEPTVGVLKEAGGKGYVLLAQARPGNRPYTVTFNLVVDGHFRHGFDTSPPGSRITRGGTISEYLRAERSALVEGLQSFVAKKGI